MAKVTEITRPRVGMHVRVRHGRGPRAGQVQLGQVAWSDEGAWTLEGSTHMFRSDLGDTVLWLSSKPPKGKTPDNIQVIPLQEHQRVRKERDFARKWAKIVAWGLVFETVLVLAAVSLMRGG